MTTTERTPADTVLALLDAIDNLDVARIGALVADDIHFRSGNDAPSNGKAGFAAAARALLGVISGVRHEIVELWEVDDGRVVVTMNVSYTRLDGREVTLPCCNVYRVRDGLIADYRIYMDVNPVLTPSSQPE